MNSLIRGLAYVLDEADCFESLCNQEMVDLERVVNPEDIHELRGLIQKHLRYTGSANAKRALDKWDDILPKFVKIYPRDYRRVIDAQKRANQEFATSG